MSAWNTGSIWSDTGGSVWCAIFNPSIKQIKKIIESNLKKHDPDNVKNLIQNNGIESSPRISVENDDIELIISLMPKKRQFRNIDGRPIGAYPIKVHWGGEENSIKNSFAKKAKRYGKLDLPYIICINTLGSKFSGDYDVMNAVWGTLCLSWSDNPTDRAEKLTRRKDGLFLSDRGPIFQNVSGVLINYVMEFNIPVSKYWLIKHPFAKREVNFEVFDMTYQYIKNRQINFIEGKSIGDILKINSNWLD